MRGVGSRNEKNLREIIVQIEIVVAEGEILLGVEHFEQGRRGVATEIHAHLVDFIETEHRVVALDLFEALDDLSRQRADVGAPVAPDFGLIAHAPEREPDEVAVHRPCNRAGERCFADAREVPRSREWAL